jgi:Raf kinase inhibitor-like YbhB/YbcL family protein
MKRTGIVFAVAAVLLSLSLAACAAPDSSVPSGQPSASTNQSTPAVTSAEQPEDSPHSPDATTPGGASPSPSPQASMSITSSGISDGILSDEYGMRGDQQKDGVPTLSLPVSIKDAPEGTVCFALIMHDPDSEPLCGYAWTHWLAANIAGTDIAENDSIASAAGMIQGKNDFGSVGYGGPTPPDKPHTYVITVYALDARLDLKDGFAKDALEKAMSGHILAEAVLRAEYAN